MKMEPSFPTASAATMLGITPETLRSWRRRGVGPAYTRCMGCYVYRNGRHWTDRYWAEKAHGAMFYPGDRLKAFAERLMVPRGRLPRPLPGRLPGGKNGCRPEGQRPGGTPPVRLATPAQGVGLLFDTGTAAWLLDCAPERLRSWRRRGIGPAYVRFPGGRICYPPAELKTFAERLVAQWGRMPRPVSGDRAAE